MFDPKFEELMAVMARDSVSRATLEGRALELASAVISLLRERGTISGADVCRLAEFVGYDAREVARAWSQRTEHKLEPHAADLEAPILRVLPLA